MLVVETPVFTRRVLKLLTDDDYRLLQHELVARPDVGNIIRGSGGLRKVRWAATGRGETRWRSRHLLLGCRSRDHSYAFDLWQKRTGRSDGRAAARAKRIG